MNKEEFIEKVSCKLSGIKESERIDIINEYALTIDEKVMNGMAEEEAVLGFGDIDEFASDILDLYRSNKAFNLTSIKNKIAFRIKRLVERMKIMKQNRESKEVEEGMENQEVKQLERKIVGGGIGTSISSLLCNACKKIIHITKRIALWFKKIICQLFRICMMVGMTIVGACLGAAIIFAIVGFPTIGITITLLGLFIAIGIWITKSSKKAIIMLISFIIIGIGGAITVLDFFRLERVVFDKDLELNPTRYTSMHSFDANKPLVIEVANGVEIDIIYDDTLKMDELELTTSVDQTYFYVGTSMSVRGEENTFFVHTWPNNEYQYEYFKAFFWNLRENAITHTIDRYTLDSFTITIHPDANVVISQ